MNHRSFLKEIWILSWVTFGGSEVHFPIFLDRLVRRRRYLTTAELVELQSLCQCLPGATSTQMLVALAYRRGGTTLGYLTLLIWALPAICLMTALAASYYTFAETRSVVSLTRWIHPIMVAILFHASCLMGRRLLKTPTANVMTAIVALIAFAFPYVYVYPLLLVACGFFASRMNRHTQTAEPQPNIPVPWKNAWIWGTLIIVIPIIGHLTQSKMILLLENFYRNGSLIFGGGYAMVPFFFSEFVEQKKLLDATTFLSGFAFAQVLPGPIFSFSAYVGFFALPSVPIYQKIIAALLAATGTFMPGVFCTFLAVPAWTRLKKYAPVQAALKGIYAACTGLVLAISAWLFQPLSNEPAYYIALIIALLLLFGTRLSPIGLILIGLALGWIPITLP